jgi:hypothetical protein
LHFVEHLLEEALGSELLSLGIRLHHVTENFKSLMLICSIFRFHQHLKDGRKECIDSLFAFVDFVSGELGHIVDGKAVVFLERRLKELPELVDELL